MTRQHSLRSQQQKPPRVITTNRERFELEFEFYKQMIQGFLNASDDYVGPFLKPVDPNEAPDYYSIIKNPMDLTTMLQKLEDSDFDYYTEVQTCFNRMFANCFRYNDSASEVYRLGKEFQLAYRTALCGKYEWIQAEAAKTYKTRRVSTDHDTDDITGDDSNASSNEGDTENLNTSPEDIRDDDETTEEELPTKRIRRRPYVLQTDDSDEDDASKKSERQSRARKKDGAKQHVDINTIQDNLNSNHKRPLGTASTTETSAPSSPQQRDTVIEQPIEEQINTTTADHASSAGQEPAKKPRLEPSAESSSDPLPQSPAQQSPNQQPAEEPQQQPTPETRYMSAMTIFSNAFF
ncbi:hypothetical protein KCU67_g11838, partial [Aureobasidium melanogenum]